MARVKSSSHPFVAFYVFHGDEDFLLDRDLAKARRWEGRNVILLDGHGLDEHELISICSTPTMDDLPRVVLVDDAHKVKGKVLKEYIEDKDPTDTSVILVAIVRSDKVPEVWAVAGSRGKSIERRKLKTWDTNNEVVSWIDAEAVRIGVTLQKGLSQALYETVGNDLYRLSSELQKLALLGGKEEVTLAHLKMTISPTPTAEPWQVAEAVASKQTRKAMNLLSTLYKNQGDDANVPLVSALMKQVEKLILARQMLDQNVSEEEIGTATGMSPKKVKFFFLPLVRKHTLRALVGHMKRLCDLDADVKGPARSKRTLVELAVLSISG